GADTASPPKSQNRAKRTPKAESFGEPQKSSFPESSSANGTTGYGCAIEARTIAGRRADNQQLSAPDGQGQPSKEAVRLSAVQSRSVVGEYGRDARTVDTEPRRRRTRRCPSSLPSLVQGSAAEERQARWRSHRGCRRDRRPA